MKNLLIVIFISSFFNFYAFSQSPIKNGDSKLSIKKAKGKITLDGILDEADWQMAEMSSPFWQSYPYDTTYSTSITETRWVFDDENIYVSAKCYQKKEKYVVLSLKRDFGPGTTDLFAVIIDPFADGQNAFSFAVSPLGVQREGLISNGNSFSTDWDNKWFSVVKNYDDYWTVEMAIPFKTIRYKNTADENNVNRNNEQKENGIQWKINMLRFDQSRSQVERSTWSFLPRYSNGNNIAFSGKLIWETPPPKARTNISIIPYVLGSLNKDFLNKNPQNSVATEGGVGFDAKVAVSSSMNLDLTVNPDFAQVEVDKQVTNLSRFELFFPERRQFFLENADLFGNFGFENINPLFTRRMGLATDANGNTVKVPIILGARLTGKLNKNWRVGLMDIQTGVHQDLKLPATNFLATAIQRKVFSRSLLSFIFVNKNNFDIDSLGENTWNLQKNAYNRVVGLDYNLASADGKWQGKFFYHRSITAAAQSSNSNQPFAAAGNIAFTSNRFLFETGVETVGKGYNAEVGYVPRRNYYRFEPSFNFVFYPKSSIVNALYLGMDGDAFFNKTNHKTTDYDFSPLALSIFFQNTAKLSFVPLRWDFTRLEFDFDPTNTEGKKLLAGTAYTYKRLTATYLSDTRKRFFVNFQGRIGEYFNGKINSLQSTFSYRLQPYGVFSLDVNYNKIDLPTGFNDRQLWLIGPKLDLSFTKDIFLTTFIQYNNQRNNINLNARFQWRFAPVSDLFIVYTDNYFAVDDLTNDYRAFQVKNRGLVLKCTYWLNL